MSKPLPFTQAGLKRAIKAAQQSGLHVVGIRPDGMLVVSDEKCTITLAPLALPTGQSDADTSSKWGDVEA